MLTNNNKKLFEIVDKMKRREVRMEKAEQRMRLILLRAYVKIRFGA